MTCEWPIACARDASWRYRIRAEWIDGNKVRDEEVWCFCYRHAAAITRTMFSPSEVIGCERIAA
jgi:hypothetical protein